jgi:LysM repeat protein
MRTTIGSANHRTQSAFAVFLRTGQRLVGPSDEIEVKFNPWHDPEDGRFTFTGHGVYYGQNGKTGSARVGGSPGSRVQPTPRTGRYYRFDPRNPANHSIHIVQRGDTLTEIAARRKGVTVADLALLNGIRPDAPLRIGQSIKLLNQSYLEAVREAKNNLVALAFYQSTHGGRSPLNPARPPSLNDQFREVVRKERKNGYGFDIDLIERTQLAGGVLVLGSSESRSKRNQAQAGRPDRLPGDDGGHFIAVRFNGPRDRFNHFAQESGFNRGRYRTIEDGWARALKAGRRVSVVIDPEYKGASRRPYKIIVTSTIDGKTSRQEIPNRKER